MMTRLMVFVVGISLLASPGWSLADSAHLVGPSIYVFDGNPLTPEVVLFEVVADDVPTPLRGGFEWHLAVSGSAAEFDADTSRSLTRDLATSPARSPMYFLMGDTSGFEAAVSGGGLLCGDFHASLIPSSPTAKSLGYAAILITDESDHSVHTISDLGSIMLTDDLLGTEPLYISDFTFQAVPEPVSLCLLAMGGLAMMRRRSR